MQSRNLQTIGVLVLISVFRIRISPDPQSFGLIDPDATLFISDPDPPLFHLKLKNIFKKLSKIITRRILAKIYTTRDFNPLVFSNKLKLATCFHHVLYQEGFGSEIPHFQFEDPNP